MAPLVVIRSGSKFVEYRESRSEWLRLQQLKLHGAASSSDSDNDNDCSDDDEGEQFDAANGEDGEETNVESRRLRRQQLRHLDTGFSCGPADTTHALGMSTDLHALEGMRGFHCADCGNLVADREDVVAKSFFGRTGKAFLMNNMCVCIALSGRSTFGSGFYRH